MDPVYKDVVRNLVYNKVVVRVGQGFLIFWSKLPFILLQIHAFSLWKLDCLQGICQLFVVYTQNIS